MNKPQTPASRSTRRLAIFILLILLAAAVVMLWKWAEKQGHISKIEHSFTTYLADADVFSNRSRKMLAELELDKTELEQRLNRLEERLQAANEPSVIAASELHGDSNNPEAQILGAVERLIVAADCCLQLTGDVRSALDLLRYAQELLLSAKVSDASQLNELLTGDIEQLEALMAVDIQEINRDIQALVAQIDNLPLLMDDSLIAVDPLSEQDTRKSHPGLRYLDEIGRDLSRLIKIEKIKDPEIPLLSPSQIYLLKENTRLKLMQARLALLTRDEDSFHAAVKTAESWIRQYFDAEAGSVTEVLKNLEKLTNINIGSQLPNLGEILGIVYHNQLMLKGESE